MANSFIDRSVLRIARSPRIESLALKALLRANELLGLAIGVRLAELRDSDDRLASSFAESEANALQARLFLESADILAARWDRLPERKRPHDSPFERFRILRIRKILGLSREDTARRFRVCPETIARWEQRVNGDDESVGTLVNPAPPPVRRYADVVRQLVHSMALCGFGGYQEIAQTLARAGWKLSKRTVARILREPAPSRTPVQQIEPSSRTLKARYPNHVWMADVTEVQSLFGLFRFRIAVVLDVFSRFPLASSVFFRKPSAKQMAELVKRAVRRFGVPRHFISDLMPTIGLCRVVPPPLRQRMSRPRRRLIPASGRHESDMVNTA